MSFWHLNHPLLVLLIAISARCPKALIHFSRWIWDWKNVQGSIYPLFTIGDFLSWIDPEIIRAWIKTPKFLWFTLKMYASGYRSPFENVYNFKQNAHIKGAPRQKRRFHRLQNRYQNLLDSFLESKGWAKGKQEKSSHWPVEPQKMFLIRNSPIFIKTYWCFHHFLGVWSAWYRSAYFGRHLAWIRWWMVYVSIMYWYVPPNKSVVW